MFYTCPKSRSFLTYVSSLELEFPTHPAYDAKWNGLYMYDREELIQSFLALLVFIRRRLLQPYLPLDPQPHLLPTIPSTLSTSEPAHYKVDSLSFPINDSVRDTPSHTLCHPHRPHTLAPKPVLTPSQLEESDGRTDKAKGEAEYQRLIHNPVPAASFEHTEPVGGLASPRTTRTTSTTSTKNRSWLSP